MKSTKKKTIYNSLFSVIFSLVPGIIIIFIFAYLDLKIYWKILAANLFFLNTIFWYFIFLKYQKINKKILRIIVPLNLSIIIILFTLSLRPEIVFLILILFLILFFLVFSLLLSLTKKIIKK